MPYMGIHLPDAADGRGQGERRTSRTPDPKDHHQESYTSTPESGRTGSVPLGGHPHPYVCPEYHGAREVTARFDHLITRDPHAMECAPQHAEYAGAQTVARPGTGAFPTCLHGGGLGLTCAQATALPHPLVSERDANTAYVPPSVRGPAHMAERPADLPDGCTSELEFQVLGQLRPLLP